MQFLAISADNNERLALEKILPRKISIVIMNAGAILFQFRLFTPTIIVGVQVDPISKPVQGLDLVEDIDDPSIVCGKRNVEGDDM